MDVHDNSRLLLALGWGLAFLALFLWLLWRERAGLTAALGVRHAVFIALVYGGVLWFIFGVPVTTLVFGHVVQKHSAEELPAVLIILGGVIGWFAMGVLALGKNRVVEFGRYVEMFRRNPKTRT